MTLQMPSTICWVIEREAYCVRCKKMTLTELCECQGILDSHLRLAREADKCSDASAEYKLVNLKLNTT